MKYLFLDTSSFYINIALIDNDKIIYKFKERNSPKLTENIFVYLEYAFKKSKIKKEDLDKIFIVNGPGSFTGVRVGLTIAKTMAWALKIPIIPLSTLELYATTETGFKYIISYINDRNGYLYAGIYDKELNNYMIDRYLHISELLDKITSFKNFIMIGYNEIKIDQKIIQPEIDIIKIIKKHESDKLGDVHLLKPNYLKMIDAERKILKQKREQD